jgi:biopolymer transport protein ExbD
MNPLIDVCLVLLIFFILTITYASLERAISIPETSEDGTSKAPPLDWKDIKDQVFRVNARMDGDTLVVQVEGENVSLADVKEKIRYVVEKSGRRQMLLDIDGNVSWGAETALLDAAKANKIIKILYHPRKRR